MEDSRKDTVGLSSADALKKLHDEIEKTLNSHEKRSDKRKTEKNEILPFYSVFITLLVIVGLIYTSYYFTAVSVLLILILNASFVYREERLRVTELERKTKLILEDIKLGITLSKDWNTSNYPHLCSPLSPCISLVWTYRDNELVNMPTALLVEGDTIVMRLGATAPGNCREVNSKSSKPKTFKLGDTYGLNAHINDQQPPTKPIAIQPLPDLTCVMEQTPFIDVNLKLSLENFLDRPPTIHNIYRNILINHYMQRYIFILTLVLISTTITLRAFDSYYIKGKVHHTSWYNIGVLNCCSAMISLLPLIFPTLWINLHHWGTARLETLLSIPQPVFQVEKTKDSPEMMDTPTSGDMDLEIPRKQVWMNYLRLLNGSCELLSRSTNIIQVLGSISAFCCVDKKGILSWPNPTPEKVFFLKDETEQTSRTSSESSLNSDDSDQNLKLGVTAEVLDVTHDQNSPFKLEFDDHEWKHHLSSLKPLGNFISLFKFRFTNNRIFNCRPRYSCEHLLRKDTIFLRKVLWAHHCYFAN